MKHPLPALALRTTRTRLLAATYYDALTPGTLDGGGGRDKPGSRLNLHDVLWTQGSYAELDRAIAALNGRGRLFRREYLAVAFSHQPTGIPAHLAQATEALPREIYVPVLVSLNAGYLEGEAGVWRMPEREQRRRYARIPART